MRTSPPSSPPCREPINLTRREKKKKKPSCTSLVPPPNPPTAFDCYFPKYAFFLSTPVIFVVHTGWFCRTPQCFFLFLKILRNVFLKTEQPEVGSILSIFYELDASQITRFMSVNLFSRVICIRDVETQVTYLFNDSTLGLSCIILCYCPKISLLDMTMTGNNIGMTFAMTRRPTVETSFFSGTYVTDDGDRRSRVLLIWVVL